MNLICLFRGHDPLKEIEVIQYKDGHFILINSKHGEPFIGVNLCKRCKHVYWEVIKN